MFSEELQKESEELKLSREREKQLETEIEKLKREISDVKSEVTIAHCTKENEIEMEKRKCAEEIATVQRFMDGERQWQAIFFASIVGVKLGLWI